MIGGRGAALLLVALSGAACVDVLGPEVGPLDDNRCELTDSDPATTVSFATDLLGGALRRTDTDCLRCHTAGGTGLRDSGLDLGSYTALRLGGNRSRQTIVVAGDPCASVLVQKLGPAPPFGARMPRNGPPYLPASDVALITDWILEGAHDN
ncbi:MAG: hypothetical protein IPH44_30105 [Myxococcales bacterium]|nr:hypothetical protein [Myxococcales bacterium]MBP6845995.1 hypothetical protein [Kofleriaceae bacterium]